MKSKTWSRSWIEILFVATLVGAVQIPASLRAQIPDQFKNLKVLPKDISKRDLVDTMRGFSMALDVRCDACHVEKGEHQLDFAADDKQAKQTARLMMRMAQDINTRWIQQVKSERPQHVSVSCVTCHHGQAVPRTVQMVLQDDIDKKGMDAALDGYRRLRDQYYGGFKFDFTERPLIDLARRLAAGDKQDDAMRILQLDAEYYPRSGNIVAQMGELYLAAGDPAKALEKFKQAVEFDPNNEPARKRLEELQKSSPR